MTLFLRVISSLVAALLTGAPVRTQSPPAAQLTHFVGAQALIRPDRPDIADATIVVRDGRVWGVSESATAPSRPAGARVVDLAGKFVIPGLIAAHVHVSDVNGTRPRAYTEENTARQLGVFARYGITTVWSLGGEQAPAYRARDAQDTAALERARIYLSGTIINGQTPDQARQQVAAVAATKPDILKIRVDDNLGTTSKMPPEVYRAVIDEAHRRGLRVAAHVYYLEDAKDLLRSGVDVIAHSVRDKAIDEEFISLMRSRGAAYCPTLTRELSTFVYESVPAFFDDPFFLREADPAVIAELRQPSRQQATRELKSAQAYKAALTVAERNLKKAADAGLLIAMGTDSGAFPERFQGYFEHLELEMMAKAGLTPRRVLAAATSDAAKAMRLDTAAGGVGTLIVGSWADFVVLDRDPRLDIRNTRSISAVYIAGNLVRR